MGWFQAPRLDGRGRGKSRNWFKQRTPDIRQATELLRACHVSYTHLFKGGLPWLQKCIKFEPINQTFEKIV